MASIIDSYNKVLNPINAGSYSGRSSVDSALIYSDPVGKAHQSAAQEEEQKKIDSAAAAQQAQIAADLQKQLAAFSASSATPAPAPVPVLAPAPAPAAPKAAQSYTAVIAPPTAPPPAAKLYPVTVAQQYEANLINQQNFQNSQRLAQGGKPYMWENKNPVTFSSAGNNIAAWQATPYSTPKLNYGTPPKIVIK